MKPIEFEVVGMQRVSRDGKPVVKLTLSLQSPDTIYDNQAFLYVAPEDAQGLKFGDLFVLMPAAEVPLSADPLGMVSTLDRHYVPSKHCSAVLGSYPDSQTCGKIAQEGFDMCPEHLKEAEHV